MRDCRSGMAHLVLLMMLLGLSACESSPRGAGELPGPETGTAADLPSYAQVVEGYNRHIEHLSQMWCNANVEVQWRDRAGKHYRQGESSKLMVVLPYRLALSVESVVDALWLGCDEQRYWLIDLMEGRTAFVGSHDKFHQNAAMDLPIKVRPVDMPRLLGLVKIDPRNVPGSPDGAGALPGAGVVRFAGAYVIEPPGTWSRVRVDQKTFLPVGVELLDMEGRAVVTAKLSEPGRVELHNAAVGAWPTIMTRVEVRMATGDDWIRLHLSGMTDAKSPERKTKARALESAFDFDRLVKALRVARTVDLDARR